MNDELGELWDRTKARPGYIADLGMQMFILYAVFVVFDEATRMQPELSTILVYGLVMYAGIDSLAPRMGSTARKLVNALADLYWTTKAGETPE